MNAHKRSSRESSTLDWHEEDGAPPPFAPYAKGKPADNEWAEVAAQLALGKGEQLLWFGRPSRAVAVHSLDFFPLLASVVICGMSLLLVIAAIGEKEPRLLPAGLAFGGFGYFIGFGRLWKEARRRARARYAVTSTRVVFLWGPRTGRIDSLDLASLSDISLSERLDHSGTITFGSAAVFPWQDLLASKRKRYLATPRFELDDGVREAFDIIREARRQARGGVTF